MSTPTPTPTPSPSPTPIATPTTIPSQNVNVNIGDYVVMGKYYNEPIKWRCVNVDENGPLMLSDKIISIKPFDAKGFHTYADGTSQVDFNMYRMNYGSNLWETSNIRSWLNSTESEGNVVWLDGCSLTHENVKNNNNGYAQEKGFLAEGNFTLSERNAIKSILQKSLLSSFDLSKLRVEGNTLITYDPYISGVDNKYDIAHCHYVTDKVFLLDVRQLNIVWQNLGDYYITGPTQQAIDNSQYESGNLTVGSSWQYWLRSPYNSASGVRSVFDVNKILYANAYESSVGVRPAFYLDLQSVNFKTGTGSDADPFIVGDGKDSSKQFIINEINMLGGGVNISITNNSGETALLCVAAYKDNKLIDIKLKQIEIVKGQTDNIASNILAPAGSTIKAFIWDDLIQKEPLSNYLSWGGVK